MLVSFLDCTKAFDKISHNGLFLKLIERKVPLCFINLFIYWLSNLSSICRWHSALSDPYHVSSGVKQGGILSPCFFTVYIDELLTRLKNAGVGCYINRVFLGSIMFADDLALIAPTQNAMQKLICICESFCREYCLTFNAKKTKAMIFGKGFNSCYHSPLVLNNEDVEYVSKWKYLGCTITNGKELSFSAKTDISSFRRSANSIVSSVKKPSEQLLMMLLYTFSVPILSYASEVKRFSYAEMQECNVALNDAVRRIFSFNRWESIRSLRKEFGYDDLTTIFEKRRRKFLTGITLLQNSSLTTVLNASS